MTLLADSMLDYKQCLISLLPENKFQKNDFCGILHKISLMRGDLDDDFTVSQPNLLWKVVPESFIISVPMKPSLCREKCDGRWLQISKRCNG